jgi:hypothetical protein
MTSSDDDLRKLLARELKAEAARFTPAEDGLRRIRGRLRSRPSFPLWGGLRVDAERYGYRVRYVAAEALAWLFRPARRIWQVPPGQSTITSAAAVTAVSPASPAIDGAPGAVRRLAAEAGSGFRAGYQRVGTAWLRPILAVAAVCLFAGTAMAVPGFRHVVSNITSSTSGNTTSNTGTGGGGSNGNGQQVSGGRGSTGSGGNGKVVTASPSPTSTCSPAAKNPPKVSKTPQLLLPAAAPSTAPTIPVLPTPTKSAAPTTAPTTPGPTDSPVPTPTDTTPASGLGSPTTTQSAYTVKSKLCKGPTPPATPAQPASASASKLPSAAPSAAQPAVQPAVQPTGLASPTTSPASSASASASASSGASTSGGSKSVKTTAPSTPDPGTSSTAEAPTPDRSAACPRHHHHHGC